MMTLTIVMGAKSTSHMYRAFLCLLLRREGCRVIIYAGIGSRETPPEVLDIFEKLGYWLAKRGVILRSGHADGADSAFEKGCVKANGNAEIFIPWPGFNGSNSKHVLKENDGAYDIARKFHPRFDYLSQGAQKLQARNSYQILGYDLSTPSDFVLCWTKKGSGKGGTGQAIRLAQHYDIPVLDFGKYQTVSEMRDEFNQFYGEVVNHD